jgi:hypothetical protein
MLQSCASSTTITISEFHRMRPSSASALLPCRGLSYATSRAEQTSGGGWGGGQSSRACPPLRTRCSRRRGGVYKVHEKCQPPRDVRGSQRGARALSVIAAPSMTYGMPCSNTMASGYGCRRIHGGGEGKHKAVNGPAMRDTYNTVHIVHSDAVRSITRQCVNRMNGM